MSVSGLKSCASAAAARRRSVASVQGWPSSTASALRGALDDRRHAAEGEAHVAAPCRRRAAIAKAGADARRCRSRSACRSCRRAPAAPRRRPAAPRSPARTRPARAGSSCSRGRSRRAACGARASPWRSTSCASSAISTGALSPIGEPLATLPPIVPACADRRRGEAQPDVGERRRSARPARAQASSSEAPAPIVEHAVAAPRCASARRRRRRR